MGTKFLIVEGNGTYRLRASAGAVGQSTIVLPIGSPLWGNKMAQRCHWVFSVRADGRAKITLLDQVLEVASARRPMVLHDCGTETLGGHPATPLTDARIVYEADLGDIYLLLQGPGSYRVARVRTLRETGRNASGARALKLGPGELVERVVVGA